MLHCAYRAGHRGFNPRPLLLTGESGWLRQGTCPDCKFQSTPVIANGRIPLAVAAMTSDTVMFQSTPVIANGRIHGHDGDALDVMSFNPRPLLLTGESLVSVGQAFRVVAVSIHARYC